MFVAQAQECGSGGLGCLQLLCQVSDLTSMIDIQAAKIAGHVDGSATTRGIQLPARHAGCQSAAIGAIYAPALTISPLVISDLPAAFHICIP
jgi:hypothetical protein